MPRFWVAYGALALAVVLLVPTLAPLSGSMDAFAKDLANGAFRPFGAPGSAAARAFSGSLGGFTGQSQGNYLPGAAEVPNSWVMDRDGRGGAVVIDAVFNPSLGAMKRLKAYDKIDADGTTLGVRDVRYRPYQADPATRYDTPIDASFQVQFRANEPVPIFSPHPRPLIRTFSTSPPVPGGVTFLQDGADTLYALARADAVATLNISFMTESRYYALDPPAVPISSYGAQHVPQVPAALVEDAKVVLARAGADGVDLAQTIDALNAYFRSFTEGDIPPPSEVESLYLALALGGHGCCRHRAFAYMVTAQAAGIPTRVVVNEAHAFVEVMLPDLSWHQVNLGGCGTYEVNNPNNYRELFAQAHDPRDEANPNEDRPLPTIATVTEITESPLRIEKGERYFVNGTVEAAGGRPAAGLRIDVFLNETKDTPGRLTGAGTTDASGRFSVLARVPRELPAQSYQLVARAQDPGGGNVRYVESWSDPPIDVFAPTRFLFPRIVAAAGFPANVTGRLVDIDNHPLVGVNVSWSIESVAQAPLRTDATGRFTANVLFEEVGTRSLTFRYEGSEHHGASEANVPVVVEHGAILLPPEAPTFARGESGTLAGTVAVAGVPLQGRTVRATLLAGNETPASLRVLASGDATTARDGSFALSMSLDRRLAPGIYPVRVEVPALRLNETTLVRVAIRPTLELEFPGAVPTGEAWTVRATLRSDDGTAIAGGIVELVPDGNRSSARALLTNRTGVARFEFPGGAFDVGRHSLLLTFPGDEVHADATARAQVEVVRPWYAALPAWAYAATLAALVLVGLAAWLLRPGTRARLRVAAARAKRPRRRSIEAVSTDHPMGVDPVYEPGETANLRLQVRHRDGRLVAGFLVADTPEGRKRGRATPQGWAIAVRAPRDAPLVVRVRAVGLARLWTTPLALHVPVRSYRQAVEEGFVALRRRARLADSATAADLVRALGPRLPSAHQPKLRHAAALFDAADYSERPVDRAYYLEFALARRDLEKAMEARDG
ncbi:MAG TPA: transglutaminase domain-containing protein [Candidatus Thermoplasmatota archaeon]|nr:transglutaminase domain-containing protein [Candidatus Thermoplasmatota archaeon]